MVGIFRAKTSELIGVDIDLRLSEIHNATALVTDQPIENGSLISDHIIDEPDTIEITAQISNVDSEKAKTSWAEFKNQIRKRELLDVITEHEIYTDMALESLSGEHTAPFLGTISVKLAFRKVQFAQIVTVQLTEADVANDINKAATTEVAAGKQPPVQEEDAPDRSILAKIFFEEDKS